MPMNRYEIRDEYSLADPELYRAADKDDPEALLEGVAMAGLVGVLRQLGDLAEFAAEIFHDLHEEVMATAARGHSLKIRVQQLEAEVPSIEKAFLSQTDLSSFFYNAGVDWHANLQLGQNLVTQGDLPRFVMDSYEECRGPPRLFLLDKFDVAGAGACLTRYTDPSFFKVETSATATTAVQREKKIRKTKKKGPHGRYGETPENLQSSSHAKLHQLLLEESVENGVTKPAYRARLKRRPNGFPFNLKSGKSYMEELLRNPSPEHKILHENIVSSPLQISVDDQNESVFELRSVSPARESEGRKSNPPYVDRDEIMPNPPMNQTSDASADIKTYGVSSYLNKDGLQPTSDEETTGKDIAIDGESKMEGSLIGYQSDEIASEIDNYVDAPSTMESEMDTDSELRVKNEPLVSVTNQEHCHSLSLDSLSTGDLSISDEGNNSYKKETSSFLSSDSPRTSAENPRSEKISGDGFPSADIPEIVIPGIPEKISGDGFPSASSFERNPEQFPSSKPVVANHTFIGKDSAPENRPDFEQPTSSLCSTNSDPTLPNYDSRAVAGEGSIRGAKSDETVSNSDDDEKKRDLILDSPCSPCASHSKSLEDDSQRFSSGEHLVDGEVPRVSTCADIIYHTSDSLDAISAYLVHEDDYDQMDLNEFENMASTMTDYSISRNRIDTEAITSKENPIPDKLDNKIAELTDNFTNDYTDIAHDGDNVASEVSEGDAGDQNNLYDEDPNVVSETVDSGDHCSNDSNVNQISAETMIFSGIGHPPVTHDNDFTPEGPTTIIGTSELENPDTSEVMGLQIAITDDINRNDLTALESSYCMPENLEDSSGISYTAEKDGVNPYSAIAGLQLTEISWSTSRKLPSQVSEPLEELDPSKDQPENARNDLTTLESSYCMPENLEDSSGISYTAEKDGVNPYSAIAGLQLTEISWSTSRKLPSQVSEPLEELDPSKDQPENAGMACSIPAIYDNTISDNVSSPAGLSKLVEEHVPCIQDLSELENDTTSLSGFNRQPEVEEEDNCDLSGSHRESGLVEEVDEREAAALDFAAVCRTKPDDYPKPEVSHTDVSSYLDSEVNHRVDIVNASHILTPLEQSGLDTEEDSFQQSGLENQLSDADSLHIGSVTEESILPENIELLSAPIDNELPDSSETISSELSSVFPTSQLQMLDHDCDKGFDNFASSFPPPNCPPSASVLPGLKDCGTDAAAYPLDTSGFIFPPGNLVPEVNPMNLQQSPSLPPLPPLQWRIGKLQHASSSTEVEKMEMKEVLPQAIFPPETSTGNVSAMPEQTKQYQAQSPQITIKEENLENGSPSLEANAMHERISLPQKIENEQENPQQQIWSPTKESEVPSPAEEVEVAEGSQAVKLPVQIAPQSALKEENPEHRSPTFEANSMNQAVDPPPEVEKEQQQQLHLVLPIQASEVPSPMVEDGVGNGCRTMKLPVSCNPVIGSVAALDKSRLRKVTEQVRPQIQKQDERDALLDQIRAKSFNLKPTATSRPIIQAPNTNLNVAAILEKANAIRQALAGSDEDDEDWSDS